MVFLLDLSSYLPICLFLCMYAQAGATVSVEVIGQFARVSSLLPSCHQVGPGNKLKSSGLEVPSPAETSH